MKILCAKCKKEKADLFVNGTMYCKNCYIEMENVAKAEIENRQRMAEQAKNKQKPEIKNNFNYVTPAQAIVNFILFAVIILVIYLVVTIIIRQFI